MYTTHTRYLLRLFGGKIVLLALLLMSAAPVDAQVANGNYNFFDFQQKPYYFGITLGYNTSSFRPFRSQGFLESDSIRVVESATGPGFNLGIITNLKIGESFDFRFLPTLSFAERNIRYDRNSRIAPIAQRKVESVFVEMPFQLRYKSAPYQDIRLFVIAGVKYSFDVASDSRAQNAEALVKIAPADFSFEYGAGIQFFFPYFIFSPEFKISHGLGNTLIYDTGLEESTVLEKLLSRTFTVSFHFEG